MRKPKILVVGSFVMDLIVSTPVFPNRGETVLGSGFATAPGGKGANQAVQAARMGSSVTMVGKVGRDGFGDELLNSARAAGVDVNHVLRSETQPSAVGNVQIEVRDGQTANRIIVVSGANMDIRPEDVAFLKEEIAQFDLVILQLEIPMEINTLVASYARDKGVPVMLNSAPYAEVPQELLQNVTFLSPNEHEAALMTGRELKTDADIEWALHELRKLGVDHAIITLGSRGVAYLGEGDEMSIIPAVSGLDIKDPTSAGDSFVGSFCSALCAPLSIGEALKLANFAAGLTCCRMGAQPSEPTAAEVLAFMQERDALTETTEAYLKGMIE